MISTKIAKTLNKQEICAYSNCNLKLNIYPKFCHYHTFFFCNLYIQKSQIFNTGYGLFVGPHGFKKNDIIGEYSNDNIFIKYTDLKNDQNTDYLYCTSHKLEKNIKCWNAINPKSTILRYANDAHKSKFKNNAYFKEKYDKNGKIHVYMIASRNIKPFKEIFCAYSDSKNSTYWQ